MWAGVIFGASQVHQGCTSVHCRIRDEPQIPHEPSELQGSIIILHALLISMQRVVGDPYGNATPRRFGEIPGSLRNPEAFQFVLQAALELAPIRLTASE